MDALRARFGSFFILSIRSSTERDVSKAKIPPLCRVVDIDPEDTDVDVLIAAHTVSPGRACLTVRKQKTHHYTTRLARTPAAYAVVAVTGSDNPLEFKAG